VTPALPGRHGEAPDSARGRLAGIARKGEVHLHERALPWVMTRGQQIRAGGARPELAPSGADAATFSTTTRRVHPTTRHMFARCANHGGDTLNEPWEHP
jgi:hypothetical protein